MEISRKQWIAAAVVLVGIAGGVMVMRRSGSDADSPEKAADAAAERRATSKSASSRPKSGARPSKKAEPRPADAQDGLSDEDGKLCDAVQDALDADDFERTRAAALKAYQSKNPDVRMRAVEALGWFGEKSLVDLVTMMADADEDVAQAAANAWEFGLSEIPDAALKWDIARTALGAIDSPDTLTLVAAQFSAAATELIDSEENEATAARRRRETVQALVGLIGASGTPKRAEVARELYEEITGHSWAGADEAERYLRDPENYEPPEAPAD